MVQPAPLPTGERYTVLVVDDEDGIRQALRRFLTRLNYTVLEASNGDEALAQLAGNSAHAMLCDIRMPAMTGVELVPKALSANADLAIIMLTAIDDPRTAIECLKLGAFDYLIKPVDLDELQLSLQSALRRRQLEAERRTLEAWLAREVAERTRELEERTAAIEAFALEAVAEALAAAGGDAERVTRLAELARRLAHDRGITGAEVADAVRAHGRRAIDAATFQRFAAAVSQ